MSIRDYVIGRSVARFAALAASALAITTSALATNTPQTLPFSQNWSVTTLITADNNWSGVPGIIGYRGDDLTLVTGTDPQTILVPGTGTPVNVIANQSVTTLATGGVAEFDGIANPVVAIQGSGTADAPFIIVYLNTTSFSTVQVAYNLRDLDPSADNAVQAVALQYRIGDSGNFTNLPAGFVADATTANAATLVTPVSVTLPAACDNQALVEVRVITTNAIGNDEWVGIDDISVTGTAISTSYNCTVTPPSPQNLPAGDPVSFTYNLVQNPGSVPVSGTNVTLTVTSGPNTGATQTLATDVNGNVTLGYTSNGASGTDNVDITAATTPNPTACIASVIWTIPTTTVDVLINELDSDTPTTDVAEFVELFDGGLGNTPLDGLVLVFYNGSNNLSYGAFDLDGKRTDVNGYFVLGNAAVTATIPALNSLTFTNGTLQNGDDAVALYTGSASDFPNLSAVTTANLRDAVVYDTSDPDAAGLLPLLNASQPQVNENGGGDGPAHSIQRCPNGSGGLRNTFTFAPSAPTPLAANTYTNVPSALSATPPSVCSGEATTLAGTVGPDETIVWHSGSCGGLVIGEGSVIVNPTSDTTYYAASKNVSSGCIGATCAEITVTTTAPPTWYLDQDSDGFGDPRQAVAACSAPPGYVGNPDDGCPNDSAKSAPGVCGCGTPDTDSDFDGTPDCQDGCPNDPDKTSPGLCGCGNADTDTDGDGTPDCHDGCPNDPAKSEPGACGCGNPETDTDFDGTPDCVDGCPNDPAKIDPGTCGCGHPDEQSFFYADADGDGYGDANDPGTFACNDNQPANSVTNNDDCDDTNGAVHPGATELCGNLIDDDCNGFIDDGFGNVTLVYVDDDFANLPLGTDPDGPANAVGCDAFGTIQEGIDAVPAGGFVLVAAGTYSGNFTLDKAISILGPHANDGGCARDPRDPGEEAVIHPAADMPIGGTIFYVTSDNVTISGLTLDGDNPALNAGEDVNGVDVNSAQAIGNGTFDDLLKPFVDIDHLTITHNIIKNFNDAAIPLFGSGNGGVVSSYNTITCNAFDNIQGFNSLGYARTAVIVYNDTYGLIEGNAMTRVTVGVQTGNNSQAIEIGGVASISSNTFTFDGVAVWHNLHYANASTWAIDGNHATSIGDKLTDQPYGLYISSILGDVAVSVHNNDVTSAYAGVRLWNNPTSSTVTIHGGTLTDNYHGVIVTNFDALYLDADPSNAIIDGATITTSEVDINGVLVDGALGLHPVYAELTGLHIANYHAGVEVFGVGASAYIHDCPQITDCYVGVDVNAGRARVQTNVLENNVLSGGYVSQGAVADFGDCTGSDVTGLGTSIGENEFRNYDGVNNWAIFNQNLSNESVVYADSNDYGYPSPVADIEDVLYDDNDDASLSAVIASQIGDFDSDGTPNCADLCPNDPLKIAPGICGCGVPDTDSDFDGTPDCNDECPEDPNKIAPGICGCGVPDTDSDFDGTPDCVDGCPNDPAKVEAGVCGCGFSDLDSDADGTPDCQDGCPNDPAKTEAGACGCGVADIDTDSDGTPDCFDGCPNDPLKTAPGACGCGTPDVDTDSDGTPDCHDGCPTDPDKTEPGICGCGQADDDSDGDGAVDCVDLCPEDPNKTVPGVCGCGIADTDSDLDGVPDCVDVCPGYPDNVDCNNNGVPDGCDIFVSETSDDINGDGVPDECQCLADLNDDGTVDAADLAMLLGSWATPGPGDLDASGDTDAIDLAYLLGAWGLCPEF